MNYDEATQATISRAAAIAEVRRHHCDVSEFLADCGDHASYQGGAVLAWLGY